MNTHDIDIELPPLPTMGGIQEAMKRGPDFIGRLMKSYARAAIEADRKRRGEPVAWSGWGCQYPGKMPRLYGDRSIAEVNCDRENGDQLLYLTAASQPAEPVKVPSDADILEIAKNPISCPCSPWWLKDGVKISDVRQAAIVFARALLARYGKEAR